MAFFSNIDHVDVGLKFQLEFKIKILTKIVGTELCIFEPQNLLYNNVSIERLDARSKIRKKLLHSNDVARGAQAIDT